MTNADFIATLKPRAANFANRLLLQFPFLTLTSALRLVDGQCEAMAENEAKARDWVQDTYRSSPVEVAVQSWLDQNPTIVDVAGIEEGLLGVMAQFSAAELHALSWHLTGEAFDIQPLTDERAPAVKSAIGELVIAEIEGGGTAKFLPTEGGLLRWHVQVEEPIT